MCGDASETTPWSRHPASRTVFRGTVVGPDRRGKRRDGTSRCDGRRAHLPVLYKSGFGGGSDGVAFGVDAYVLVEPIRDPRCLWILGRTFMASRTADKRRKRRRRRRNGATNAETTVSAGTTRLGGNKRASRPCVCYLYLVPDNGAATAVRRPSRDKDESMITAAGGRGACAVDNGRGRFSRCRGRIDARRRRRRRRLADLFDSRSSTR